MTAVVGIKDRATNKISAQPVPETTMPRLENFIESKTTQTAKKYTDESPSYNRLSNHESVRHSVGEYVRGQAHINGMESFWSMVRRGYDGIGKFNEDVNILERDIKWLKGTLFFFL